jgi:hypothetical protein
MFSLSLSCSQLYSTKRSFYVVYRTQKRRSHCGSFLYFFGKPRVYHRKKGFNSVTFVDQGPAWFQVRETVCQESILLIDSNCRKTCILICASSRQESSKQSLVHWYKALRLLVVSWEDDEDIALAFLRMMKCHQEDASHAGILNNLRQFIVSLPICRSLLTGLTVCAMHLTTRIIAS